MGSLRKNKRVANFRTICEVHREIYDILECDKNLDLKVRNKVIDLLEEAYIMAKKMNGKLQQYKKNYDDGWWEREKEIIIKEKLRLRKGKRNKSIIFHSSKMGEK